MQNNAADDANAAEQSRRVEVNEADTYADMFDGVSRDIADRLGLSSQRIGSAVVLSAAGFQKSLIVNRVIGLGAGESFTPDMLDQIERLYAAVQTNTYALEISPASEPPELMATLKARGFFRFKQTAMLHRRVEVIAPPACALRIRRAAPEQAAEFVDICVKVFGLDEPIRSLLATTFAGRAWQHWLAFDGDMPVGAALTHLAGDVAWFGWVGTLSSHRGRGAQSALTAAQLEGATESGCRWVTLETATGTAEQPHPSMRNYCRLGWTVAHQRGVFVRRGRRSELVFPGAPVEQGS